MKTTRSRKLAVILHADVVDSTKLVQTHETLAHERMRDAFDRFSKVIDSYHGITHEIRGDALVAEFARASDAVSAALAFQNMNSGQNASDNEELKPVVRIGIAMGEVIVADNTITGEGVVLAQRLEQLAAPAGICIQSAARETIPRRLPFKFSDPDEQNLKGFESPVRVTTVELKRGAEIPPPETPGQTGYVTERLPDKPSIAVLPFTNMGGDPEQEYFSDGITEDVITALSRLPWFFVIARNSSFAYKSSSMDTRAVARELAVHYVLEGSVRKSGNRVRITAQLIDALSGKQVWAERYDRELTDVFELQDAVVESIVGEVAPEFLSAEAKRARRADPVSLNAWDAVMRGRWHMWKLSREHLAQARVLFDQAVSLTQAGEYGASDLALVHMLEAYYGWADSREESMQSMQQCAEMAVAADDHDAWAHTIMGVAHLFAYRWEEVLPPLDHAIRLYPNFAPAIGIKGMALACLDDADGAIECFNRAVRLSPHDSLIPLWLIGKFWAHWSEKQYPAARDTARETVRLAPDNPTGRRQLAASHVTLDQIDEARSALADYLNLEPGHTVKDIRVPSRNPEPLRRFVDALRTAGLPD